jgi:alpha-L-rhamnosidase
MKKLFCFLIGILFMNIFGYGQVIVKNLRCENRVNPLGVDILNPRFSWQLVSDQRKMMQTAYEIRVGTGFGKSVRTGLNSGNSKAPSAFVP